MFLHTNTRNQITKDYIELIIYYNHVIECSKMLSTTTILNIILRLSIVTRNLFVPIIFQLFSNNMESSGAISILILNVVLKIFEYSNLILNNSVVWPTWSILKTYCLNTRRTYVRVYSFEWRVTSKKRKKLCESGKVDRSCITCAVRIGWCTKSQTRRQRRYCPLL